MLSAPDDWVEMVEVNPPRLPNLTHRRLEFPLHPAHGPAVGIEFVTGNLASRLERAHRRR